MKNIQIMTEKEKITGFVITKDELSEKASKAIEDYQKEFTEKTGGRISKAMAAVRIIELYSDKIFRKK